MLTVLSVERHLTCPNCAGMLVSRDPDPNHQVFHRCPGLRGLTAPMIDERIACKVEAVGREDYENGDRAHRDGEGNVVMAVEVTRDDGTDRVVFAPTAFGTREEVL